MNVSEAKKLIRKFLDGKSSLEEEQMLGDFLRETQNLPDELMAYKQMFAYFDEGMTDRRFLVTDDKEEMSLRPGLKKSVWMKAFRAAAAVAAASVIFFIIYGLSFTGDMTSVKKNGGMLAHKTLVADSLEVKSDSIDCKEDYFCPNADSQKKWRYKPVPLKPHLAENSGALVSDSINEAAMQVADDEIRKIEEQQQYVINLIKAFDIINSAEIASVADNADVY